MEHEFRADRPQSLYVELQSGDVAVEAGPVDAVTVEVTGREADRVRVEQDGHHVSVVAPRARGFFTLADDLRVRVTMPELSDLTTKCGSASVIGHGLFGEVRIATGSGDVTLEDVSGRIQVKTGSGTVSVGQIGAEADLKAGSGRIRVGRLVGDGRLATGSGDIEVGWSLGSASLKSGSGDLYVGEAQGDTSLTTASGDLHVGRISQGQATAKNVSGDIRVGIPAGVPVWTDISSSTGHVRSSLTPTGAPAAGQDHVEVRAKSVTGDIYLEQVSTTEEQS